MHKPQLSLGGSQSAWLSYKLFFPYFFLSLLLCSDSPHSLWPSLITQQLENSRRTICCSGRKGSFSCQNSLDYKTQFTSNFWTNHSSLGWIWCECIVKKKMEWRNFTASTDKSSKLNDKILCRLCRTSCQKYSRTTSFLSTNSLSTVIMYFFRVLEKTYCPVKLILMW